MDSMGYIYSVRQAILYPLFLKFNTRVTSCDISEDRLHLGKTIGVFEEDNVSVVLDELALLEDADNFSPATSTTF